MIGTRFTLEVRPVLPERLARLDELANDLLYSWDRQVRSLFFRLDAELWETSGHKPKVFLRRIAQSKLDEAAEDRVFLQDLNRVLSSYDTYLQEDSMSGVDEHLDPDKDLVAYFCAEFGFHESFPIYSGGLGILAGDHCKAASDLNVPFVAIGLLYRQGYFNQTIDVYGHQQAHYTTTDFDDLPITPAVDNNGNEIHINVAMAGRNVEVKVWQAKAGHIRLYLLDTDLPSNTSDDRAITHQLYGGDVHTRIQQEIILGIGGVRALRALGLRPSVWHINEGHAAFMILERCREHVSKKMHFDSALEIAAAGTVFTTHTPVPAGHDIFEHSLMEHYFNDFIHELGIDMKSFLSLGASPGHPDGFNQTALALRGSRYHNGVSRIHGGVASQMEEYIWPQIPHDESPMRHVTNGVHVPTFLAREWVSLFDMRFGGGWRNELLNEEFWQQIDDIPDQTYWTLRQTLKSELFEHACKRARHQHTRNGLSDIQIARTTQYIDPTDTDVLTFGFARRFATYKRATLLFSDLDRLARIVNDPERPVVFLFAGKAHPADQPGQEFIRIIHDVSRRPEFVGKILLLEGYDMALARKLVTGVDVWLNTPEYPLEASGTSGEKAGINGVMNLSVLDGWWGEGYNGENGWAIAPHGPDMDPHFSQQADANELLDLIENEVVPLYYIRDGHGYSASWVNMSKASMKSILPRFNSARMVMDYVQGFYGPASQQCPRFKSGKHELADELAHWKKKVMKAWPKVAIRRIDTPVSFVNTGGNVSIEVAVKLGELGAEDVVVECLNGIVDEHGSFDVQQAYPLTAHGSNDKGETLFHLDLHPDLPGLQAYKLRVYPFHHNLTHRFEMGCMLWV
ncbi:MAG: alpha-glucan family phosphorylase [Granulosicoccaceae bacterium]|jgi:starch phosphorylase